MSEGYEWVLDGAPEWLRQTLGRQLPPVGRLVLSAPTYLRFPYAAEGRIGEVEFLLWPEAQVAIYVGGA